MNIDNAASEIEEALYVHGFHKTIAAILRKHAYPRLIESRTRPEGHICLWVSKHGNYGLTNDPCWTDGVSYYDIGPLPQKGGS